eukprot:250451_1
MSDDIKEMSEASDNDEIAETSSEELNKSAQDAKLLDDLCKLETELGKFCRWAKLPDYGKNTKFGLRVEKSLPLYTTNKFVISKCGSADYVAQFLAANPAITTSINFMLKDNKNRSKNDKWNIKEQIEIVGISCNAITENKHNVTIGPTIIRLVYNTFMNKESVSCLCYWWDRLCIKKMSKNNEKMQIVGTAINTQKK